MHCRLRKKTAHSSGPPPVSDYPRPHPAASCLRPAGESWRNKGLRRLSLYFLQLFCVVSLIYEVHPSSSCPSSFDYVTKRILPAIPNITYILYFENMVFKQHLKILQIVWRVLSHRFSFLKQKLEKIEIVILFKIVLNFFGKKYPP
jgi:hypothetical protein